MIKRKLLFIILIWQIICSNFAWAATSSGTNFEFIPAAKNLGVGIQSPTTKLDLNGQIMIRSGSPGADKILSSDANGKASWVNPAGPADASTLDSLDSLQFLRSDTSDSFSSGVFITDSGTRFDINGDLSIADTNISLDGANTSFTQSTGDLSFVPASGKDLSSTINSGGEFKINTSDLVFNGSNARVGIGTSNPSTKLDVNGTIKGLTINGSSANFTNITTGSLTNTGTSNFTKLIVTNNVNGATGNFTTGNFTNAVISGIVNGSTSSFDGDFTDGSVFFSNNNGVISQDNSHFYWDQSNKRLAINHANPDMALDVNGAMVLRNINDGNIISGGGSGVTFGTIRSTSIEMQYPAEATKPAGTTNGDLLISFGRSMAGWQGWTEIISSSSGKHKAFYRIASNEPTTYYFGNGGYAIVMRYTGHDPSNPINASAATTGTVTGGLINTPSVTTTVANTKIVKIGITLDTGSCNPPGNPSGYTSRDAAHAETTKSRVADKDQVSSGASDTNTMTSDCSSGTYDSFAIAIAPAVGTSTPILADPDNGSTFLYLSNGGGANANPGDLFAKITEASVTKTIQIIDFNNGKLATSTNSETIDGIDSPSFLRSDSSDNFTTGTLTFDTGTTLAMSAASTLDINSTNVSIADTGISLDGADTTFTQTTGNLSFIPASGKDLTSTISNGGEFRINTNDLVFNGTSARIGIGTANPSTKLDVNGTVKGLNINGTSANFTNINTSKLISSGSVNGATANFSTGNFTTNINTSKLISTGPVNGTTANFNTFNTTNLTLGTSTINTLNSSTINNSGTITSAKLLASGTVNGATANFNNLLVSGSVNGSNANFTNAISTGIFNGTTSSFDGDFSNGSILFSNADGVISQNNSQLYWERSNARLGLGLNSPNERFTINGVLAIKEGSMPSGTSGFAKLYINPSNSKLYFQNDSGISYNLTNGSLIGTASPAGNDTEFQFNNGNYLSSNGALAFIKASKTLSIPTDASFDINSSNVSIADPNISFDSASETTFTPSPGQNLNIALSSTGDFTVNTNQLYVDTSSSKLGLSISNPNETLTANGNFSIKEGSAPSSTTNFGKLYVKSSDSKLYFKNSSGSEYDLISPSAAAIKIDDLSDAITNPNVLTSSLFIGSGSGVNSISAANFNTAVGIDSMNSNTQGSTNAAMGYRTLYSNTTGAVNNAFGSNSLYSNTTGLSNIAFGSYALTNNVNGNANIAFGNIALATNTAGSWNTAVGYGALNNNSNGDENLALGYNALQANRDGNGNIAIGAYSLLSNTLGNYNTAVGTQALNSALAESYNTAFGYNTLIGLKHGTNNFAAGPGAMGSMSNGSANVAIGVNAGNRGTNSYTSNGLYLGYKTGFYDSGNNNIIIGHNTGNGSISGSNNILIGYNNNLPSGSTSNQLDIGDTIYGDLANRNIGIGTSSIDTKLEVNGLTMSNLFVTQSLYNNSSGTNVTINWNNSNEQVITLGHNVTFAFTAPTTGVSTLSLILIQDGTGSRTATWPASVKWPGGTPPVLSTTAGRKDVVTCVYESPSYLCQIGFDFR